MSFNQVDMICDVMGIEKDIYLNHLSYFIEPTEIQSFNEMFEIEMHMKESPD